MSRVEKGAKMESELSSIRSELGSVARDRNRKRVKTLFLVGTLGLLVLGALALGIAFSTGMMYIDVPTMTVRLR